MKKILLTFILFFLPFSVSAGNILYSDPDFSLIAGDNQQGGLANQYIAFDFDSAQRFCIFRGETYVGHTNITETASNKTLYIGTQWTYFWSSSRSETITCDDGIIDNGSSTGNTTTTSTGSVYITTNNINYDGGIGEDIFTIDWAFSFFQLLFTGLLFWSLIIIAFKFNLSTRRPNRFKFSNILK